MNNAHVSISNEQYNNIQNQLILLAQIIADMDLSGFLQRIDTAETLGPMIDPTLYLWTMNKLDDIKSLAQAARHFQQEAMRQISKAKAKS